MHGSSMAVSFMLIAWWSTETIEWAVEVQWKIVDLFYADELLASFICSKPSQTDI